VLRCRPEPQKWLDFGDIWLHDLWPWEIKLLAARMVCAPPRHSLISVYIIGSSESTSCTSYHQPHLNESPSYPSYFTHATFTLTTPSLSLFLFHKSSLSQTTAPYPLPAFTHCFFSDFLCLSGFFVLVSFIVNL